MEVQEVVEGVEGRLQKLHHLHNLPMPPGPAFLFDLDGTLVDSVYQHVLAWREALESVGIELSVWRIHRRIGMSGGLFGHWLFRLNRRQLEPQPAHQIPRVPVGAYARQVSL